MSINEQRIREFAYQIWESEGKPYGQGERHWTMACKLAQTHAESDKVAASDGQNLSGNDGQHAGSTEPIEPISPSQPAQPVPPSDPIQPTDPVQPAQPVQPASPSAVIAKPRNIRAKTVKTDTVKTAAAPVQEKAVAAKKADVNKPAKPGKIKAVEDQLS